MSKRRNDGPVIWRDGPMVNGAGEIVGPSMTQPEAYPHECYIIVPGYSIIGRVTRGEPGYTPCAEMEPGQADQLNERLGVSHAQREAMEIGSAFGWHVPGADPRKAAETFAHARLLGDEVAGTKYGAARFEPDMNTRRRSVLDMHRAQVRGKLAREACEAEDIEDEADSD